MSRDGCRQSYVMPANCKSPKEAAHAQRPHAAMQASPILLDKEVGMVARYLLELLEVPEHIRVTVMLLEAARLGHIGHSCVTVCAADG